MSEIERDKLSLPEVKGYLKDHIAIKESMKLYFLIPGKELVDGLMFLTDDSGYLKMVDYVCVGGVAHVYVEYHGEEDSQDSSCGSDFEDEILALSDDGPNVVITAAEPAESETDVLIPDETGVVTQIISSPVKHKNRRTRPVHVDHDEDEVVATQGACSQVLNPSQPVGTSGHDQIHVEAPGTIHAAEDEVVVALAGSDTDSESEIEYIPHSEDSGEDSEVVELRRHARKFKKRMRDSKSWIGREASGPVPIGLIADGVDHTFAGEPQKEGMMQYISSFPLITKPRLLDPVGLGEVLARCQQRH